MIVDRLSLHSRIHRVWVLTNAFEIILDPSSYCEIRHSGGCLFCPPSESWVRRFVKDGVIRKLVLLGKGIRPAFSQTHGFYPLQTSRGSTSSHSISDTVRHFMDQHRVVKRSISVGLGVIRVDQHFKFRALISTLP